jgi:alanine racemase
MFPTPTLTVDTGAIVANWKRLRDQFSGRETSAVVKADAYGLGMRPIAEALAEAGCDTFFVATLDEALALRQTLPDRRILVLHGVQPGEEFAFRQHRIIPVLNSAEQLARWTPVAKEFPHATAALHVDTGMGRMGVQPLELEALLQKNSELLRDCRVGLLMSHLACAPEKSHPENGEQLNWFNHARNLAPEIPASLCNSGGIYLDAHYHFDLARPGCALYGIAPQVGADNPMLHTATWMAPMLMLRTLERDQFVGYNATMRCPRGSKIATVASGYADGYLRSSRDPVAYIGGHKVPLVGIVTMDMLCFDVSSVPDDLLVEGAPFLLLGDFDGIRVDDVAHAAGTIGYEVLTRIGSRVARVYE